ncbi:hypothetical protein HDU97_006521 [Phlyctochytrium planicorne]|nr:hypothetical protein HDU97_006521 [Phlyctochytrium planicorne]
MRTTTATTHSSNASSKSLANVLSHGWPSSRVHPYSKDHTTTILKQKAASVAASSVLSTPPIDLCPAEEKAVLLMRQHGKDKVLSFLVSSSRSQPSDDFDTVFEALIKLGATYGCFEGNTSSHRISHCLLYKLCTLEHCESSLRLFMNNSFPIDTLHLRNCIRYALRNNRLSLLAALVGLSDNGNATRQEVAQRLRLIAGENIMDVPSLVEEGAAETAWRLVLDWNVRPVFIGDGNDGERLARWFSAAIQNARPDAAIHLLNGTPVVDLHFVLAVVERLDWNACDDGIEFVRVALARTDVQFDLVNNVEGQNRIVAVALEAVAAQRALAGRALELVRVLVNGGVKVGRWHVDFARSNQLVVPIADALEALVA